MDFRPWKTLKFVFKCEPERLGQKMYLLTFKQLLSVSVVALEYSE
jgi:hypothetical protein